MAQEIGGVGDVIPQRPGLKGRCRDVEQVGTFWSPSKEAIHQEPVKGKCFMAAGSGPLLATGYHPEVEYEPLNCHMVGPLHLFEPALSLHSEAAEDGSAASSTLLLYVSFLGFSPGTSCKLGNRGSNEESPSTAIELVVGKAAAFEPHVLLSKLPIDITKLLDSHM